MGQALYRKYRSKSLTEIVGQEHITTTLQKALDSDRISHAYLFTGPRGVGKTSIARILAHAINNLPYDETQPHIDIIEIDAASNRRIDEIRDLRDKVNIAPAIAKYKVYIIDEVHMLTKEAFNALLKTLEEPPAHVVFILATTEAHKLPATIISRTQRFIFRPIEPGKAVAHLRIIAKAENIEIEDKALELVVQHGDGSFRDSISLLDQAASLGGKANIELIRGMLGIPSDEATTVLLASIENGSTPAQLIALVSTQYNQGFQATAVAEQLAAAVRKRLIAGTIDSAWAAKLLAKLLEVGPAVDPERYLEIVLISEAPTLVVRQSPITQVAPTAPVSKVSPEKPAPRAKQAPLEPVAAKVEAPIQPKEAKAASKPKKTAISEINDAKWPEVLALLKKDFNTLYGIVRMAQPDFGEPGELLLTFAFAFHEKRVKESKNQQAIGAAVEAVYGEKLAISCVVDPALKLSASPIAVTASVQSDSLNQTATGESLSAISNIFGAAEVLE